MSKQTTKVCHVCGNTELTLCRSQRIKICSNSAGHPDGKNVILGWYLDKGQKPVGY
jgi:hypothetical protein